MRVARRQLVQSIVIAVLSTWLAIPIAVSSQGTPQPVAPTPTSDDATASATSEPEPTPTPTPIPQGPSIRIESENIQFGQVDASGTVDDQTNPDTVITASEGGAVYVMPGAITLVVIGDAPWTVSCAAEGADAGSEAIIDSGRLLWRNVAEGNWTPFSSSNDGEPCLANNEGGSRIFVLDVQLWVQPDDPPGTFAAQIEFTVSPL